MLLKLFIAVLVLSACGAGEKAGDNSDSEEPVTATSRHSFMVQDATVLPPCDAAAEGWLVYLKTESKFQGCSAGAWADVPVNIKGEDGKAGVDNHITHSIVCTGTIPNAGDVTIDYSAALLSSGDVFATAAVRNPEIQASATNFYSVKQEGAKRANVLVPFDFKGNLDGGYWDISIDRASAIVRADYKDEESGSWLMEPDACLTNNFYELPLPPG